MHTIRAKHIIIVALMLSIIIYGLFDPITTDFLPSCLFRKLTGYKCPGCGSQRAICSILHGNFETAFYENSLFVIALPYFLLILMFELFDKASQRFSVLYKIIYSASTIKIILLLILAFGISRNFLGF